MNFRQYLSEQQGFGRLQPYTPARGMAVDMAQDPMAFATPGPGATVEPVPAPTPTPTMTGTPTPSQAPFDPQLMTLLPILRSPYINPQLAQALWLLALRGGGPTPY